MKINEIRRDLLLKVLFAWIISFTSRPMLIVEAFRTPLLIPKNRLHKSSFIVRPRLFFIEANRKFQCQNRLHQSSSSSSSTLWGSSFADSDNNVNNEKEKNVRSTTLDDNNDDDPFSEFRNKNNIRDQIFSAISKDGGVKVTACTVRNLVNDMMIQNTMTEIPSEALSRTMICALLMSNGMQDEQMVQITMNSDGPLRGVVAMAKPNGGVRGFVGTPMLGNMSLQDAVGNGAVQVVKNHPSWPRPYNGITAIRHRDIDRDVGIYLAESEQRSCALAASTSISGILCKASGGYLIEQLPDVDSDTVKIVENNLQKLVAMDGSDKLPTGLLLNGKTPLDMVATILDGLDMQPLQQIEPKIYCDCTEERLIRSLRLLPRDEVEDILTKEEKIEARCEFCGKVYTMGPSEIRQKLNEATGDPSKDDP